MYLRGIIQLYLVFWTIVKTMRVMKKFSGPTKQPSRHFFKFTFICCTLLSHAINFNFTSSVFSFSIFFIFYYPLLLRNILFAKDKKKNIFFTLLFLLPWIYLLFPSFTFWLALCLFNSLFKQMFYSVSYGIVDSGVFPSWGKVGRLGWPTS